MKMITINSKSVSSVFVCVMAFRMPIEDHGASYYPADCGC